MGFYPCSGHGAFFKGAAEAAYPALVSGVASDRAHLRFCHDCFVQFLARCEEALVEVRNGTRADTVTERVCCLCGAAAGRTAVFVTAYPKGEPERRFFGGVCDEDVDAARAAWLEPVSAA